MKKFKLNNFIRIKSINKYIIQESFKEFIISTLTDDQLEEYGEKYRKWFNQEYDKITNQSKQVKDDLVIKNLILFNHLEYAIEDQ